MIKTKPIPVEQILLKIPEGKSVGILGCGECAAVLGTGGTRQIDEWRSTLGKRNPVAFSCTIDSPCDQRTLRRGAKFIDGFQPVDVMLALVCPIGGQSLGDFLRKECPKTRLIVGLTGEGAGWLHQSGESGWHKCHLCPSCTHDPEAGLCRVANCPLQKADGPCQNRDENDHCPLMNETRCVWVDREKSEKNEKEKVSPRPGRGSK